jgi:multiple sugar transport system ATP-binding protein
MAEVILKNVRKTYGSVLAVKDFSLDIADQEFVVLVGPSGCGKSTTLRMIAGLEEISGGTIAIGDRVVNDLQPKDRDIAMVFQNYALYQHMSVYDNLAFGMRNRRTSESEIAAAIQHAAKILSIEPLLERRPRQLSGGQQQRVALGRCIVRNPKVFLFDEPLSNLDAQLRAQMRLEIKELRQRVPTTSIFVTHDQVEAMTLGDRIVVMKDGLVQQVDEPLSLYEHPKNKFVAGFIGSPPMNFMTGTIEQAGGGGLTFNEGQIQVRIPARFNEALKNHTGKSVVLGIRPEDIHDPMHFRSEAGGGQEVSATVEVIEPMGSDIYLYLTTGKTPFIANVEPDVKAEIDDKKKLVFNMDKAHFFDSETEENLVYALETGAQMAGAAR